MTVSQFIKKLQKVKNQNLKVYFYDCDNSNDDLTYWLSKFEFEEDDDDLTIWGHKE